MSDGPSSLPRPAHSGSSAPLLSVRDLRVTFDTPVGPAHAVDGVSFDIAAGGSLGIVGESGSGKSLTALAITRLITSPRASVTADEIRFNGIDLANASSAELRRIRGRDIAMVFQEPMASLNPVLSIGYQVTEARRIHGRLDRRDRRVAAPEILRSVRVSNPDARARQFPHHLSGGMRQRVMIAGALSCDPSLLILDEPTTALDVTVQAQILDLVRTARQEKNTSVLLITHDLGVIAENVETVAVMYAGRIVEYGPTADILASPRHPYTEALIDAMPSAVRWGQRLRTIPGSVPNPVDTPSGCRFHPRCRYGTAECTTDEPVIGSSARSVACWHPDLVGQRLTGSADPTPARVRTAAPESGEAERLLALDGVSKTFRTTSRAGVTETLAVDDVTLTVNRGEILGIVGESGCGKTSLGRLVVGLERATSGSIRVLGRDVSELAKRGGDARDLRRQVQFVFQDPFGSLNPRMKVRQILDETLRANAGGQNNWRRREGRNATIAEALESVALDARAADRYPHEFSGGQRQRIAIARAVMLRPRLIVCDEPVSALDVSVQAQILNLLSDLRTTYDLTLLFIAHDISVVQHLSDRIAVMYRGRVVEIGSRDEVSSGARHPYTTALLSAVPRLDADRRSQLHVLISGELPQSAAHVDGCCFNTRCWLRAQLGDPVDCTAVVPQLSEFSPSHRAACYHAESVQLSARNAMGD